jgi:hypothetical protein
MAKPATEAERFSAFAKKVVSVPKAEIEKREAAYKESAQGSRLS